MDISKLCRSCMKEVASWERENFDNRAVQMFCFCTNITVADEEKLPKQFCYDCVIKIESSYTFVKEAQNVNITLRNIVSRNETSVIVQPESVRMLENCSSQIIHKPKYNLKLTLPDYKLCCSVSNFVEKDLFHNVDKTFNLNVNTIENEKPVEQEWQQIDDEPKNVIETKEVKLSDETKKNVCAICRKCFTSKVWFAKHMEKEHSGQKYACTSCPKTFAKASQLAYHAASHSEERAFACGVCGKRFKRRKQLATHSRTHNDLRPYACDKCTMRFKVKSVLKCHMKVHEGDKQYLCSFCGWSFAQASNLAVHIRKHTGDKPYACAECPFRSAAASSLRRHERSHRDARLYLCTHCRKGFYDASALARHTRTHTGELPYQCPGCARAFSDSWKRKTHLMRAHRLALADIPRMRRDGRALRL